MSSTNGAATRNGKPTNVRQMVASALREPFEENKDLLIEDPIGGLDDFIIGVGRALGEEVFGPLLGFFGDLQSGGVDITAAAEAAGAHRDKRRRSQRMKTPHEDERDEAYEDTHLARRTRGGSSNGNGDEGGEADSQCERECWGGYHLCTNYSALADFNAMEPGPRGGYAADRCVSCRTRCFETRHETRPGSPYGHCRWPSVNAWGKTCRYQRYRQR
jgi:hypothetical protein